MERSPRGGAAWRRPARGAADGAQQRRHRCAASANPRVQGAAGWLVAAMCNCRRSGMRAVGPRRAVHLVRPILFHEIPSPSKPCMPLYVMMSHLSIVLPSLHSHSLLAF